MRSLWSAFLGLVMLLSARRSHAQSATLIRSHALTVAVGATTSRGGDFIDRSARAAALSIERTVATSDHIALVGGLHGLLSHRSGSDLTCPIRADNSCPSPEPDLLALTGTIGARIRASVVQLDARVGPDLYATKQPVPNSSGVGVVWGIVGTLRVTQHLGLSYTQDTHVLKVSGDQLRVTAHTGGVRVAW